MSGSHGGKVARSYECKFVDFDPTTAGAQAKGFTSVDAQAAIEEAKSIQATETNKGIAEVATTSEVTSGVDDTTIITPLKLKQYVDARLNAWITVPIGTILTTGSLIADTGFLMLTGQRVAVEGTYAALTAKVYCGDGLNATAAYFYRCNADGTVRSTSGTHLQLPDPRGEFVRFWDNGRGVDTARTWASKQAPDTGPHKHQFPQGAGGDVKSGNQYWAGEDGRASPAQYSWTENSDGTETRPRNICFNAMIRY